MVENLKINILKDLKNVNNAYETDRSAKSPLRKERTDI